MVGNIGNIERLLRIVVGLALVAAAYFGKVGVWGYIGVVPFLTGVVGWCPPYHLLGINTKKS